MTNPDSATVTIDHTQIPADHLAIALSNAALDPDGQTFPWRPGYPLAGSTAFCRGQLWTVERKETGPGAEAPTAMVRLAGQGHDAMLVVTRSELRPITWTQHDEDWLGRE